MVCYLSIPYFDFSRILVLSKWLANEIHICVLFCRPYQLQTAMTLDRYVHRLKSSWSFPVFHMTLSPTPIIRLWPEDLWHNPLDAFGLLHQLKHDTSLDMRIGQHCHVPSHQNVFVNTIHFMHFFCFCVSIFFPTVFSIVLAVHPWNPEVWASWFPWCQQKWQHWQNPSKGAIVPCLIMQHNSSQLGQKMEANYGLRALRCMLGHLGSEFWHLIKDHHTSLKSLCWWQWLVCVVEKRYPATRLCHLDISTKPLFLTLTALTLCLVTSAVLV